MDWFATDTPVLRFELPRVAWRRGPSWVLWPAWGWRVVAPHPRPRKLNMFQKAVLGLCRAGRSKAEDIGARLMIDAELAAHVVLELQGMGWLDPCGAPTSSGNRALEDDEAENVEDQTVGWVFSDPFTGDLWPRFRAGELPYATTQPGTNGFPELVSGSLGNPRRERAFSVLPRGGEPILRTRPRAEDIVRAVRAHRRQYAWSEALEAADAPLVRRVSFVAEDPQPYLLAARAWLAAAGDWRIDDPFGIGDSARLRRWIEGRLDTHPGLRAWLAPVAGGEVEVGDLESLVHKAEWMVEERLTIAVRSKPTLCERLVAMQRALLETDLPDCPEDKWDDVSLKAQRAAECVLQEIRELHPPRVGLTDDFVFNEQLLQDLAHSAGFRTPLPQSLVRVRRGKIQYAAEQGTGSLRPLLLAVLLGTPGEQGHPFVGAARRAPELLHQLDALASVRDEAGHESRRRADAGKEPRRRRTREGVEAVFSAVALLTLT